MTIEVGKTKEGLYIPDFGWGKPCSDAIKFDWVYSQLIRFHNHSKVFDFRNVKLTFLKLQVEVEFSHPLEDTASLFFVGLWVGGGTEKVIHVDDEPSFSNHILEGVVHKLLEHGRRVTKAKEHDG